MRKGKCGHRILIEGRWTALIFVVVHLPSTKVLHSIPYICKKNRMSFIIIYITHENEAAAKSVVNQLVEEKLVACGNLFPIQSAYWWQGAIQHENEWVSIVKTVPELWEKVVSRVEDIHPYEVPCIMKLEAEANEKYEEWIQASVRIL